MKLNWLSAAMVAVGSLATALPAAAGDIAAVRPIGFSADGSVFAFEEYGVQSGVNTPYSNIFAIDLNNNTFLPDTPVRLRGDDDKASMAAIRKQSMDQVAKTVQDRGLLDHPGEVVAFNPLSEIGTDPHVLSYRVHASQPTVGEPNTLTLEELDEGAPAACKDQVQTIKGFRLKMTQINGAKQDKVVYEDGHVPASRRCPTGYRLGGVVTYQVPGGNVVQIALVLVMNPSSEGSDGRWLAVPIKP
ncbi:DUF2259 domain-containing protein [Agrobacterium vitis]|uniref:DUF2259 domain-containing protein n=1 Tax=Agrobacterium vitis TaxID=373 RepID=A0ABD6G775_AGRVI|nr:DUF2259 domain-containing protein [Agrobacterium vitis]MUO77559.1 DUF2259 domain-containing protein [Agrobacterium vitis]MUO93076.1 DUF2259 domain-containing protein [Agrobacterium vitis]MUP04427.1 DUF2259 domain-containing protein [Agrobacterium vitis]MUZ81133.1 DUF2259 domain-containing protein [Agrobacterium vitis]MVA08681.1 DUF2259 domain-containing protein [Agrobacterium vitis]